MNFAVIKTGGKQYKVATGDKILVEKLSKKGKELKKGDKITFDEVLLFDDGKTTKLGRPTILGAQVEAIFENEEKQKKVTAVKYKNKTNYRHKIGHRQIMATVTINSIKSE